MEKGKDRSVFSLHEKKRIASRQVESKGIVFEGFPDTSRTSIPEENIPCRRLGEDPGLCVVE